MLAHRAILLATLLALGFLAAAPAVEAAPPNIPPGSPCNYFHYHSGNLQQGQPPRYHYHHCI